eukprot:tig00020912_g15829.t1
MALVDPSRLDGILRRIGASPVAFGCAAAAASVAVLLATARQLRAPPNTDKLPEPPEASELRVILAWLRDPRFFDRILRKSFGECFSFRLWLGLTSKKITVFAGPEASRVYHHTAELNMIQGYRDSVGQIMPPGLFDRERSHMITRVVATHKFPAFTSLITRAVEEFLDKLPTDCTYPNLFTFLDDVVFDLQARILFGDEIFEDAEEYKRFRKAYSVLDPTEQTGRFLDSFK